MTAETTPFEKKVEREGERDKVFFAHFFCQIRFFFRFPLFFLLSFSLSLFYGGGWGNKIAFSLSLYLLPEEEDTGLRWLLALAGLVLLLEEEALAGLFAVAVGAFAAGVVVGFAAATDAGFLFFSETAASSLPVEIVTLFELLLLLLTPETEASHPA